MSRIIIKFSGEALKDSEKNVSESKLQILLSIIKKLQENNHQIAIVIGGGNFFRGREHSEMNRLYADTIGMLGSVMNSVFIKDYFEKNNVESVISTPFTFPSLIDNYKEEELLYKFNNNNIVIFGAGIGKSGFSTDSGVIRACDIVNADMIIKLTNVDGVYDSDPRVNSNAKKLDTITYEYAIQHKLKIMDEYAIQECQKKNIKIIVMNIKDYKKVNEAINGELVGSLIGV